MNGNSAKTLVFLVAAAAMCGFSADGAGRYLGKLRQEEGWTFCTEDGASVSRSAVVADKGCDVTIVDMVNDNTSTGVHFDFGSWTIAATNENSSMFGTWSDGDGSVTLREGGLTMAADNVFRFGHKGDAVRVKLAASQTWRGPVSGTTWAEFGIGCNKSWNGYYWKARVQALDDIVWTLDGRIRVVISASNDLSNVDIVVNPQARLILAEKWSGQTSAPHLNARSLTLKGGDAGSSVPLFTVGAGNPATMSFGSSVAPSPFDDVTVAPKVTLLDGASVNGGTVDYGVSELSVSGGDSTFSGDVTLVKDVAIDIASGACLTFTGNVVADGEAGLELTGEGTLRFEQGLVSFPVRGDGVIAGGADGGETVVSGDLSGFTGTIFASAGTVLVHPDAGLNAAATLSAAEGATCRLLTAADFGEFTSGGKRYYRGADGVRHQYLYLNAFDVNMSFGAAKFREVQDVAQSASWINGSVLVVDGMICGQTLYSDLDVEGVVAEETASVSAVAYFDGGNVFSLGGKGIDIQRTGYTMDFFFRGDYFRLAESQRWSGPDATALSDTPARINVGGNWNYYYPTGSVTPARDGLDLAISGDLSVHLYYPSNDMSRANITVESPARLRLEYPGGVSAHKNTSGRLKANRLTLDGANAAFGLGKNDRVSSVVVAKKLVLKNGASLSFDDVTWSDVTLASEGTGGRLAGSYVLGAGTLALEAGAGSILDLTDATFTPAPGITAGLSAAGSGTLKIDLAGLGAFRGPLSIDGPALSLVGTGRWAASLASVSGLSIASSETVYIDAGALAGYGAGTIAVTAGTLLLDSADSLPAGCKVVTSGTGALALVDDEGFDADAQMDGTKAVAENPLVITDAAREGESITVGNGQTLHVFGSGLKASSSVSLSEGATLVFRKAATIESPVTVGGASVIASDENAPGVFSGALAVNAACNVYADGGIVFTGGAAVNGAVRQRRGRVEIRDAGWKMSVSAASYNMYEGRCVISNCTYSSSGYADWRLDCGQTGDAVLELAPGGTLSLGNNSQIYIGRSVDYESRLLIDGGTMSHDTWDHVYVDKDGDGRGVIEFAAGRITSRRQITVGYKPGSSAGYAKFIWRGGTWAGNGYRYTHLFKEASADCGIEFSVAGTNCVLDLGSFNHAGSVSNFCSGASTMVGEPGARLTVKGKSGVASKLTLVDFTPNGMALDLNATPHADVEIVGDGSALELGWVVPGNGGTVSCGGTASPLLANYVVPSGTAFRNDHVNDGWNSGFSPVSANDLVFRDGSSYLLCPTPEGLSALDIAGSVVVSGTVVYAVDRTLAPLPAGDGIVLVNAPGGCTGGGVWSAAGENLAALTRVYAGESCLLLDSEKTGLTVILR